MAAAWPDQHNGLALSRRCPSVPIPYLHCFVRRRVLRKVGLKRAVVIKPGHRCVTHSSVDSVNADLAARCEDLIDELACRCFRRTVAAPRMENVTVSMASESVEPDRPIVVRDDDE